MPFDANLILHGLGSGGSLVDCDEGDTVAILTSLNEDGNQVVDLKETGGKGLVAVLMLTEEADSESYGDDATITIEVSDALDRHWETIATFPKLYAHIRRVFISATTAFIASDVGKLLTETTSEDTGTILYISPELLTTGVNGGYVDVVMVASGDVYDEDVDTVETATDGQGVGTKAKGTEGGLAVQMQPGVYMRRFTTSKRYVRCNCEDVDDSIGKIWILLTNAGLGTL